MCLLAMCFGKMVFCPFSNWVIFIVVVTELCELLIYLDIYIYIYIVHIICVFSYLKSFLYILSVVCCAKAFSLNRSHLFIFAFVSFALGERSKKNAVIYVRVFCLCFFYILIFNNNDGKHIVVTMSMALF